MTEAQQPESDANRVSAPGRPPGVPRWVKVSGILIGILIVVLVVAMLAGGEHGPGRHQGAPVQLDSQSVVTSAAARTPTEGFAGW